MEETGFLQQIEVNVSALPVHHLNAYLVAWRSYRRNVKYSMSLKPFAWRLNVLILLLRPSRRPLVILYGSSVSVPEDVRSR